MTNTCLHSISKQRRKNTAQTRHSCTISPLHPPGEPSPARERRKKYGTNAPQLRHILGGIVVVVRARVVEWSGGDPCGRPGVCQHPIFYNDNLDKSLDMTCGRPGVCQLSTRWARAIMKKLEL